MIRAAAANNLATARILIADQCTDPAYHDNEALCAAAGNGAVEVLECLLAADPVRVDPAARGNFPIRRCPTAAVARALLRDERVDPSAADVVALLTSDHRFVPSPETHKLLLRLIKNGNAEMVCALLQSGRVDPSARNSEALLLATVECRCTPATIVDLLLADGRVNPSAGDNNNGSVVLAWAFSRGDAATVERLLSDKRVRVTKAALKETIGCNDGGASSPKILAMLLAHPSFDPVTMLDARPHHNLLFRAQREASWKLCAVLRADERVRAVLDWES